MCVHCPVQAICLLTSLFGRKIAMLEIRVAVLVRSQQRHDVGRDLSVLPRYSLPEYIPCTSLCIPCTSLCNFTSW